MPLYHKKCPQFYVSFISQSVIWEIFSLGKDPYHGRTYEYVFEMLERGEHLPCPEDVKNVYDWPASHIYEELAQKCFALHVEERDSFYDLVVFIRSKLNVGELKCYKQIFNFLIYF